MKTTAEKIAVMQAFEDGKVVMCRPFGLAAYHLGKEPSWNWGKYDYWVKPEPAEVWVNIYDDGDYKVYTSESEADTRFSEICPGRCAVHLREVMPDDAEK